MIFEVFNRKDTLLEKVYEKSMKEFNHFFGLNWNYNLPNIFLVPNRKTIDLLKGHKTESWVVGWVDRNNIFLLDKKNYNSESSNKYSQEEYLALLKHELCHLFFQGVSKGGFLKPRWIDEGVSIFLSGQTKLRKKPQKFEKFLDFYDKSGSGVYRESGFAVELLVNKYGKNKLLTLLKSLKEVNNQEQFNKLFKKIYSFSPSYKNFNKLLK